MNRIRLGDECTKYFHAMATLSYRRNSISQLNDDSGMFVCDNESKAALLWSSFKNRMGVTSSPEMYFDLPNLIQAHADLSELILPFTSEEIDMVIKQLPVDKAPGPDWFNGMFLKKCWNIIKEDIYKLCEDFFDGHLDLESINYSYITLLPKVRSPESVNDFRPISLLNSSIKILTKLLADRLQRVILQLIHINQYGFIRSRTI